MDLNYLTYVFLYNYIKDSYGLTPVDQTYKCLANGPVIVVHDVSYGDDGISFTKSDKQSTFCIVYTLRKNSDSSITVIATAFMKRNPIKQLFFRYFVKSKLEITYIQTFENLNKYCNALRQKGELHPWTIELKAEAEHVI